MGGSNTYKGRYKPENPEKYRGPNIHKITYRSSWELHIFRWIDRNPHVVKWGSETVVIPYWSSADNKKRRYYMDIAVKFDDGKGTDHTHHLTSTRPSIIAGFHILHMQPVPVVGYPEYNMFGYCNLR